MARKRQAEEKAYQYIKQKIDLGEWLPETKLIEADLCDILAISRTPIRKAIDRLVGAGYLALEKNKGVRVREKHLDKKAYVERLELMEVLLNHYLLQMEMHKESLDFNVLHQDLKRLILLFQNGVQQTELLEGEIQFMEHFLKVGRNQFMQSNVLALLTIVQKTVAQMAKHICYNTHLKFIEEMNQTVNFLEEKNYLQARKNVRILINQLSIMVL